MNSFQQTDDGLSAVARRIQALIDESRSSDAPRQSGSIDIAECLLVLQELWPDVEPSAAQEGHEDRERPEFSAPWPRNLGRFELRRLLGSGGFGVVLLAGDKTLDREVALKLPRPELLLAGEMRSRFLREAKAAALLDHPGIVPVFDAGEVGPLWYIAAGYVKGPSLAQWMRDNPRPVPARTSAAIVLCIAEAVQHAHSRGILHRDLKPSNVLLEPKESTESAQLPFAPKLTDFGLAKHLEAGDDQTISGVLVGTPRYMAPEQAANRVQEVGVATDVYGLGAILHELLTGEPPFVSESNSDVLQQIQHAELSPSRLRSCAVPKDLETICLKCLEKEPSRRYQRRSRACRRSEAVPRWRTGIGATHRSRSPACAMVSSSSRRCGSLCRFSRDGGRGLHGYLLAMVSGRTASGRRRNASAACRGELRPGEEHTA